jgi:hypothetical protein
MFAACRYAGQLGNLRATRRVPRVTAAGPMPGRQLAD